MQSKHHLLTIGVSAGPLLLQQTLFISFNFLLIVIDRQTDITITPFSRQMAEVNNNCGYALIPGADRGSDIIT